MGVIVVPCVMAVSVVIAMTMMMIDLRGYVRIAIAGMIMLMSHRNRSGFQETNREASYPSPTTGVSLWLGTGYGQKVVFDF